MLQKIIVVDNPDKWNLRIENVPFISAREYLTDSKYRDMTNVRVYNLCKSYRYQSLGYYVSLIAQARGHKVLPDVMTIQDLKMHTVLKSSLDDIDELVQRNLKNIKSEHFELSIYFGRNVSKNYDTLAKRFFDMFTVPFLRVFFEHDGKRWAIATIKTISSSEIPVHHYPYVEEFAKEYFSQKRMMNKIQKKYKFDIAILHDPNEEAPPSCEKALKKFVKAANCLDMHAELITKNDYGRLAEFDALFIRETTNVHHHTYRFARKAEAEGLVVIDDPTSILRCTNKVYLEELLDHHSIRTPKCMILHKNNIQETLDYIGLPCVLKQPDSAFSMGVHKAKTYEEYLNHVNNLLGLSDLVIVQEFLPSSFDWRIGILGGKPLYACKYFMAKNHWQIKDNSAEKKDQDGDCETMAVAKVPDKVIASAVKTAKLIGNGLYGVDIKEIDGKVYVIEINDNPNLDHGYEDNYLKDDLYDMVMKHFHDLIEEKKSGGK